MIRITELALPLDYTPEALRAAVVKRLKIRDAELLELTLFKRSYDARKKNTGILFICIVDVKVADEAAVLKRFARDRQIWRRARHLVSPGGEGAGAARRSGRSSSASVPAVCLPRCCWRRWASSPSCSSAAATCAGARRTPGRCGARRS